MGHWEVQTLLNMASGIILLYSVHSARKLSDRVEIEEEEENYPRVLKDGQCVRPLFMILV